MAGAAAALDCAVGATRERAANGSIKEQRACSRGALLALRGAMRQPLSSLWSGEGKKQAHVPEHKTCRDDSRDAPSSSRIASRLCPTSCAPLSSSPQRQTWPQAPSPAPAQAVSPRQPCVQAPSPAPAQAVSPRQPCVARRPCWASPRARCAQPRRAHVFKQPATAPCEELAPTTREELNEFKRGLSPQRVAACVLRPGVIPEAGSLRFGTQRARRPLFTRFERIHGSRRRVCDLCYAGPAGDLAASCTTSAGDCPWTPRLEAALLNADGSMRLAPPPRV